MPDGADYSITNLEPDIGQKVRSGELKLPLYADMTILDEKHRRLIFGMMLSQEGKCRVPIYETMTKWGLRPGKGYAPDAGLQSGPVPVPGLLVRHQCLRTAQLAHHGLRRLFDRLASPDDAAGSLCSGAAHLFSVRDVMGNRIRRGVMPGGRPPRLPEKMKRSNRTWNRSGRKKRAAMPRSHANTVTSAGRNSTTRSRALCQDYCGRYKSEHTLELGLKRLDDLNDTEGERTYAGNPHELARLLEALSLVDLGKLAMEAAKARKCSSRLLSFYRLDYPEIDPPEWHCFFTDEQEGRRSPFAQAAGRLLSAGALLIGSGRKLSAVCSA